MLSEGVTARIRLGELVFDDGARPFTPDVTIPRGSDSSDDAAVAAARTLIAGLPRATAREPTRPGPARGLT